MGQTHRASLLIVEVVSHRKSGGSIHYREVLASNTIEEILSNGSILTAMEGTISLTTRNVLHVH